MLEQQEQDCAESDYYGGATNNTKLKDNIIINDSDDDRIINLTSSNVPNNNGVVVDGDEDEGDDTTATSTPTAAVTPTPSTTTTVRIHTTYKKRASKFMNRPNVQNGLGTNSLLHPYGASSSGGGIGRGSSLDIVSSLGSGGSGSRLFSSHQNVSTLGSSSSIINNRISTSSLHRSVTTTRSSIFGVTTAMTAAASTNSGSAVGIASPLGTTTGSTTTTTVESRPPFVTTVTRGRFLPSKFDLMVEKSLFTFSSRPKPVGLITKHQCSLSGGPLKEDNSQSCQPRGAHDYFNVMWDPHVYRGTTTTLTSSLKQPDISDLTSSGRDHDRHKRRRAFLAGAGNNMNSSQLGAGANCNSNTSIGPVHTITTGQSSNRNRYRMTTKVTTSRSRTFPPIHQGRHQVHVQTEEFLEDLTKDMGNRGPDRDAIVQTDPIEDDDLYTTTFPRLCNLPDLKSSGIDASTQVLPGELISFEERVQPIVEAVVGKILEQALLETMEEEEIGALKAQQNRFLEKRKEEERELKRLQEQQERISAEKERLKRHLEMQFSRQQIQQQQRQQNQNGDVETLFSPAMSSSPLSSTNMFENGSTISEGAGGMVAGNNSIVGSGAVSTSYLLELLPSVINSLRQEGFITDQIGDGVLSSFAPLWTSSSSRFDVSNNGDGEHRIDADDEDDNSSTRVDGYQSRANSLDIAAAITASEDQQEDSSSNVLIDEEEELVVENDENEEKVELPLGGEEGDEDAKEIFEKEDREDDVKVEEKEETMTEENENEEKSPDDEVAESEGDNNAEEEEVSEGHERDTAKEEENLEDSNISNVLDDDLNQPNNNENNNNNPSESLSQPQLPNGAIPHIDSNCN